MDAVAVQALAVRAELGERPVWDDHSQSLAWVDIDRRQVHRFDPVTGTDNVVFESDDPAGCVGLRAGGGLVVGAGRALLLLDSSDRLESRIALVPAAEDVQFNDGAVDPAGRFVGGTSSAPNRPHGGALYSIDTDRSVRVIVGDVTEANGVGWSPDGATMYFIDSGETYFGAVAQTAVRRYRYDVGSGDIGRVDDLAVVPEGEGLPDGLVVDSEGAIWVGVWGGGEVRRYTPDGGLLGRVSVPASLTTCPGFGGPSLRDLYITTAQQGMDDAARAAQPMAGDLFVVRRGVSGMSPGRYLG